MDHPADEVHEQPQEPVADDIRADTQDFPSRSHGTLVLMNYVYHVAATVWAREVLIT